MEQLVKTLRPSKPFDPAYDPNRAANPGDGKDYAPTYWIATAGPPPADDGPVLGDIDVDVAIVGSGYTGLSCAIHLAKEHGIKATVLEANGVAWGCSTRNGGQAQISAGRLKRSQWIERWGVDVARKLHVEISEAFDLFRDLIRSPEIACDPQDGGHLYIAHRNKVMPSLEAESRVLNDVFGYRTRILGRDEIHRDFVRDNEAVGALYEPDGMGIHAAKLAFGYLTLARKLGARVHTSSPVLSCDRKGGVFHLRTPGGIVRARAVCFATAGYTSPGLHSLTKHRLMPILSNSIVTRVLTDEERSALNFQTHIPLTDTRTLRHYYRLLPDGRVQIGSRSAITGKDAVNPKHLDRLLEGLYRKFPVLTGIKVDYSWWGWVDVSHDMMPRIFRPDPQQALFYAMGYGGNGVMYSAQAGRRMAQMVAGKGGALDLPIFTSPLPSHGLLTPFRRIGQWGMYRWYYLKDEIL
ncbi:FAD-dependent oxidoreductase [Ensifer sp. T173]|uniref:FAD-dependent oxidoreductase n=1 Tax=Ensifer canadensis TaxID=555315 RepID=A0AAW4FW15_9HYPH|nr:MULTISPECIES: FAD-binding oxidoreductase [Ensifer]AHK46243.1 FAD dependent oxidoreductase [Ensifer adhaerens OV14]KQW82166.1 FAD-dependent oxidoreductase [Ensifer sp. Root127]MBM3095312.1 FAD-dependent oxidoreductase [Ensifer canadensis]NOV17454.1 FAD-binding oxidoreductase [Ensifer canadensis]UBI78632.1 FAD-binding oxidoreductase [Ensifer canadensis]